MDNLDFLIFKNVLATDKVRVSMLRNHYLFVLQKTLTWGLFSFLKVPTIDEVCLNMLGKRFLFYFTDVTIVGN